MSSSGIFTYNDPEIAQVHAYTKTLFLYTNEILIWIYKNHLIIIQFWLEIWGRKLLSK